MITEAPVIDRTELFNRWWATAGAKSFEAWTEHEEQIREKSETKESLRRELYEVRAQLARVIKRWEVNGRRFMSTTWTDMYLHVDTPLD